MVTPSPDRIAPVSPHYGECGGCTLQHWAAEPYLAWKREQVRLQLAREGIETEIEPTVAVPAGSRRRVALHARRKADGGVALGFKARKSWALVEISRTGSYVYTHPQAISHIGYRLPQRTTVTPVAPTVVLSSACDVEGSLTVSAVTGVRYLLDGTPVTGTLPGPLSGTLTAEVPALR